MDEKLWLKGRMKMCLSIKLDVLVYIHEHTTAVAILYKHNAVALVAFRSENPPRRGKKKKLRKNIQPPLKNEGTVVQGTYSKRTPMEACVSVSWPG